jgi:antitoxin CptB
MTSKLEIFKKRIIYRASYRGTKEMDILLSSFVNKYIDSLDLTLLNELEIFLIYEDETILNYYHFNIIKQKIDKNKISKLFKSFKI